MEDMHGISPDEFMERMKNIYRIRDEEFQKREAEYQKKYDKIQKMTLEMSEERKRMESEKAEIKKEQEEIRTQEAIIEQKQGLLNKEKADLENREQELVFKNNLELEELRNEEMKVKRLREDYEYKITLIDHGLADMEADAQELAPDPERYILRSEHQQLLDGLRREQDEAMNRLRMDYEESIRTLKEETEDLKAERVNLLKQNLKLSGTLRSEPSAAEEKSDDNTMIEELTAEVLKNYIERNKAQFRNLKIFHSDDGEQLSAESRGLQLRFLFAEPPRFDILAQRKNSSMLRKKLEEMNRRNPEISFQYEDGEVCATGFFTVEMPADELLAKVERVSDCFK